MAAVAAVLIGLSISVAPLSMCRSRKLRDIAAAASGVVLPAVVLGLLICGLLFGWIS
jgi:hypothetical protein